MYLSNIVLLSAVASLAVASPLPRARSVQHKCRPRPRPSTSTLAAEATPTPSTSEAHAPAPTEESAVSTSTSTEAAPTPTAEWEQQYNGEVDEQAPAPTPSAEPSTTSTSEWVEPSTSSEAPPPAPSPESNNGGGDNLSGESIKGSFTYYNLHSVDQNDGWGGGVVACYQLGKTFSDHDMVIAVNTPQFAGGSRCGDWVSIKSPHGHVVKAQVVDQCASCSWGDIDLTPAVWDALGVDRSVGKYSSEWSFDPK